MKKLFYLALVSVSLVGCDSVHLEYLWTERHPVPEGVYTPPPIQQLQRNENYFVKDSSGEHTEESRLMMMRYQYRPVQDAWTSDSKRICKGWCEKLDTNVGLRSYWRSQGTIMDEALEERQRKLGIHNMEFK